MAATRLTTRRSSGSRHWSGLARFRSSKRCGLGGTVGGLVSDLLVLGGTGVLGRSVLSRLRDCDVVATTRRREGVDVLERLGALGVVCDVYDRAALVEVAAEARPRVVANFLTDLKDRDFTANDRIRSEVAPVVVAAAEAAGAERIVVESISFAVNDEAVDVLERSALASVLQAVVLRFGLFWGPGTWYASEPDDDRPHIHVEEAGRRAAELLFGAAPGIYVLETGATQPAER